MIESVLLFCVGIGALLVSIVSILRMAWLRAAAYGLFMLNDHRPPRPSQPTRRTEAHPEKSRRMAA